MYLLPTSWVPGSVLDVAWDRLAPTAQILVLRGPRAEEAGTVDSKDAVYLGIRSLIRRGPGSLGRGREGLPGVVGETGAILSLVGVRWGAGRRLRGLRRVCMLGV